MSIYYWLWFSLQTQPIFFFLWLALGLLIAYNIARIPAFRRHKTVVSIIAFSIFAHTPYLPTFVRLKQKEFNDWLEATCAPYKANPVTRSAPEVVRTEGFLDRTNYDALMNDRFQRYSGRIADRGGGTTVIDTGRYDAHASFGMVKARTFNEKAHYLLTVQKYGFAEYEMIPGSDGDYSNSGTLNTRGWKGKKYRRYYLDVSYSPHCVRVGEVRISASVTSGKPPPKPPPPPYCLALEIVSTPISKLSVQGTERFSFLWWGMKVAFFSIPIPLSARWDDIVVTDDTTGKELGRYSGFHYPDPVIKTASCHNYNKVGDVLINVLAPSNDYQFLKSQSWYQGSRVQEFYESK